MYSFMLFIKHESVYLDTGPIGLPIFGNMFRIFNYIPFGVHLGQTYPYATMYPFGPGYHIVINDLDLILKLSRNPAFTNRPKDSEGHLT